MEPKDGSYPSDLAIMAGMLSNSLERIHVEPAVNRNRVNNTFECLVARLCTESANPMEVGGEKQTSRMYMTIQGSNCFVLNLK